MENLKNTKITELEIRKLLIFADYIIFNFLEIGQNFKSKFYFKDKTLPIKIPIIMKHKILDILYEGYLHNNTRISFSIDKISKDIYKVYPKLGEYTEIKPFQEKIEKVKNTHIDFCHICGKKIKLLDKDYINLYGKYVCFCVSHKPQTIPNEIDLIFKEIQKRGCLKLPPYISEKLKRYIKKYRLPFLHEGNYFYKGDAI